MRALANAATDWRSILNRAPRITAWLGKHGLYALTFVVLSVLLVRPVWMLKYLPLGDLPDHASQLRTIVNFRHYASIYRFNWFTPYFAGYLVALAFTPFVSVLIALKLALSISLLGVPVASAALIRATGGNRYWVWTSFPTAYGFAFHWGFFNFVVATPLAIGIMGFAWHYASRPLSVRRCLGALLFSTGLFCGHALAWLFGITIVALVVMTRHSPRQWLLRMLPFLIIVPFVVRWMLSVSPDEAATPVKLGNITQHALDQALAVADYVLQQFQASTEKQLHLLRLREMISLAIGMPALLDYILLTLLLLTWPLWIGGRFSHDWKRYLPLGAVVAFYMVVPYWIFGNAYTYERFSAFVIPASYFCFENGPADKNGSWRDYLFRCAYGAGGLAVVMLTLRITHKQFERFRANDKDFDKILAAMKPDKKVLALAFDAEDVFKYSPTYMHFGSWYQAMKRGEAFPSPAYEYWVMPARYNGTPWQFPSSWNPGAFDWKVHEGWRYDYFLVDSIQPRPELFRAAGTNIKLLARYGIWWLYGRAELADNASP